MLSTGVDSVVCIKSRNRPSQLKSTNKITLLLDDYVILHSKLSYTS